MIDINEVKTSFQILSMIKREKKTVLKRGRKKLDDNDNANT